MQVLEILSHVNKRIKGHDSIALPLEALLDLSLAADSAPLVRNFGLVYAEMACDRATPQQRWQAVRLLSAHLRLICRCGCSHVLLSRGCRVSCICV